MKEITLRLNLCFVNNYFQNIHYRDRVADDDKIRCICGLECNDHNTEHRKYLLRFSLSNPL